MSEVTGAIDTVPRPVEPDLLGALDRLAGDNPDPEVQDLDVDGDDAGDGTDDEQDDEGQDDLDALGDDDNPDQGEDGEDEDDGDSTGDNEDGQSSTDDKGDSFLSADSLKKHQKAIKENPALQAVYNSMLADYRRKTADVAKVRGKAEQEADAYSQARAEMDEFVTVLKDVSEDGGRENFLLEAALDNIDLYERVYQRATELVNDPDAKKGWEKEQDLKAREAKVAKRDQELAVQQRQEYVNVVRSATSKVAADMGIGDKAGLKVAIELVAAQLRTNEASTGKFQISREQLTAAVKKAADTINEVRGSTRKQSEQERRKKDADAAKVAARGARRPTPTPRRSVPGKVSPPPVTRLTGPQEDPLDKRVRELLNVRSG